VGDDVAELTAEGGMAIGMAMGCLELLALVIGELVDEWESRR
jgi:hypothetical protein